MLRNITVVKVGYADIEDNVQQEREIKQRKVKSVIFCTNNILNGPVDP